MSSDASPKVALRTLDSDAFDAELDRAMDAETPLDPCWPTRSRPSLEVSDMQSPGTPWMASLYALSLTMAGWRWFRIFREKSGTHGRKERFGRHCSMQTD